MSVEAGAPKKSRLRVLLPLMMMALGFTLLFFTLHLTAIRTEILRRRVATLRRMEARRAERKA